MTPIEGERRIILANAADIALKAANGAVNSVRAIVHVPEGLAVGVGRGHEEAAGEFPVELRLQCVVVGTGTHELESDVAGKLIEGPQWLICSRRCRAGLRCGIEVVNGRQVYAVIAHVGRLSHEFERQRPLHTEVPRFRVRFPEIQIDHCVVLAQETCGSDFADNRNNPVGGDVGD